MNDKVLTAIAVIETMDSEDLNDVIRAIRDRQRIIQSREKFNFRSGDHVWFLDKNGNDVHGTVIKRMQVNIKVKSDTGTIWTVDPTLLNKVN